MSVRDYISKIGKKNLSNQVQKTDAVQKLGKQIIFKMT